MVDSGNTPPTNGQNSGDNPFANISILVVDDDALTLKLIKTVLETFGFKDITATSDGNQALAQTSVKPFGFIMCDWKMSPLNGIEFVQKVRHDKQSPNRFTPIIMVTGKNSKEDVSMARDAGVTEFIIKPFSAKALASRIIEIVENPRNFIISRGYTGPDRRRREAPLPPGTTERRTET